MLKLIYFTLLCACFLCGKVEAQTTGTKWQKMSLTEIEKELNALQYNGNYKLLLAAAELIAPRLEDATLLADSSYLPVLELVGDAYYYVSDFDKAILYTNLLLEKSKAIKGGINKFQSTALNNLGLIYSEQLESEKAVFYCQQSLAIEEKLHGKKNLDYTVSLNNLALLHKENGNSVEAEAMYLEGIGILQSINDTINDNYIALLNNLASFYASDSDFETGRVFISQALTISQIFWGEDHPETARLYLELGYFYDKMGELTLAEKSFLKAAQLLKEKTGASSQYYLNALTALAQYYQDRKQPTLAIRYFKEIFDIETRFFPEHPTRAADIAMRLGTTYLTLPDSAKTEQYFLQAHDLMLAKGGQNSLYYLEILNYLADFYIHKNPKQATAYLCQALNKNYSLSLTSLSLSQILPLLQTQEAQKISESLYSLDIWTRLLDITAAPNFEADNYEICKAALRLLDQQLTFQTNEYSQLRLLARRSDWTKRTAQWGNRCYQKTPTEALLFELYQIAESNKANLILKNLQAEKNYTFGNLPDSLIAQEQQLFSKYQTLKAALLDAETPQQRQALEAQINQLNIKIKNHQLYINNNYPQYSQLKNTNNYTDIKAVQQLLSQDDALLMYVTEPYSNSVFCFYIDKKSSQLTVLDIQLDTLSAQTQKLRQALTNYEFIRDEPEAAYHNYTAPAHWFYQQCIAPLPIADHIKHLIIIPDGELSHLPFETFLTQPAPEDYKNSYHNLDYLIRKYSLSYNYSASLWAENSQHITKANNNKILAMAADYNTPPALMDKRSGAQKQLRLLLNPLPAAIKEVQQLSTFMSGDFISDTTSTEAKFKQIAPKYNIIHLAMHGILDQQKPILSSLAFTEDGGKEDNFLRAHEISNLQLSANLVVLSACETGYGKLASGEGILSLARAFMYAGTPSLLVSMWSVNDDATALLMQLYYQNLQKGLDKASALQATKIEYLQTVSGIGAHPAFWAAFIQIGDNRPLNAPKSYLLWYLIAAAAVTASLAALLLLRRRRAK